MTSSLYVNVHSFLWSAAPGQDFLTDTLTVTNSSGSEMENLSGFDDLVSGLARNVDFVTSAPDAAAMGYSSTCGVNPLYPSSLCPVSLGAGLTVDSDSANHNAPSVVTLSPGSSAQIALSYGPVMASVKPTVVTVYFDNGQSKPVDLTP